MMTAIRIGLICSGLLYAMLQTPGTTAGDAQLWIAGVQVGLAFLAAAVCTLAAGRIGRHIAKTIVADCKSGEAALGILGAWLLAVGAMLTGIGTACFWLVESGVADKNTVLSPRLIGAVLLGLGFLVSYRDERAKA